jgi:hypothetical protein
MVPEEVLAFHPTAMVLAPGSRQRVAPQARAASQRMAQAQVALASQPTARARVALQAQAVFQRMAQVQVPLEAASQPMAQVQVQLEAVSRRRARAPELESLRVSSRVQRRRHLAEAPGCRSWSARRQ